MNPEVLNSWKEIAAYLGRGVRTVQRWEQDLGLPVRRPRGKERSAVIALKPDLDRWLHQSPQGAAVRVERNGHERKEDLHINTERLIKRTHEIVARSARMQEMVKTTVALTAHLREQQTERMRSNHLIMEGQKVLVKHALDLRSSLGQERQGADAEPASRVVPRKG